MATVMSSGSPHGWDGMDFGNRASNPVRLIGTVGVKKQLGTQQRMELFSRVAELVRAPCGCYDAPKQCDRCFDLLQLFRIHKDLLGQEFVVLRRREEERLAEETPDPKKQYSDGRQL